MDCIWWSLVVLSAFGLPHLWLCLFWLHLTVSLKHPWLHYVWLRFTFPVYSVLMVLLRVFQDERNEEKVKRVVRFRVVTKTHSEAFLPSVWFRNRNNRVLEQSDWQCFLKPSARNPPHHCIPQAFHWRCHGLNPGPPVCKMYTHKKKTRRLSFYSDWCSKIAIWWIGLSEEIFLPFWGRQYSNPEYVFSFGGMYFQLNIF